MSKVPQYPLKISVITALGYFSNCLLAGDLYVDGGSLHRRIAEHIGLESIATKRSLTCTRSVI